MVDGFLMVDKRLGKGRFKFHRDISGAHYEIDHQQLQWLFAGLYFMGLKHHSELKFISHGKPREINLKL